MGEGCLLADNSPASEWLRGRAWALQNIKSRLLNPRFRCVPSKSSCCVLCSARLQQYIKGNDVMTNQQAQGQC